MRRVPGHPPSYDASAGCSSPDGRRSPMRRGARAFAASAAVRAARQVASRQIDLRMKARRGRAFSGRNARRIGERPRRRRRRDFLSFTDDRLPNARGRGAVRKARAKAKVSARGGALTLSIRSKRQIEAMIADGKAILVALNAGCCLKGRGFRPASAGTRRSSEARRRAALRRPGRRGRCANAGLTMRRGSSARVEVNRRQGLRCRRRGSGTERMQNASRRPSAGRQVLDFALPPRCARRCGLGGASLLPHLLAQAALSGRRVSCGRPFEFDGGEDCRMRRAHLAGAWLLEHLPILHAAAPDAAGACGTRAPGRSCGSSGSGRPSYDRPEREILLAGR